jgi:hypothetical protein
MRTTLTLDDDVAAAVDRRRRALNQPLRQVVNDLLRAGLAHVELRRLTARPLRVEPLDVGELLIDNIDGVSAVLAICEGDDYR